MILATFNRVADVPIHYAREPVAPYGTIGKGPREVRLRPETLSTLHNCVAEINQRHPWGMLDVLVSGGCYVEKAGRHGEGRAIDIDALWWVTRPPLITKQAPDQAVHYLGVEAIIRRHFGVVLNYWYNRAHEDHWHIDDGDPPGWRPGSRARALFLQASLTYVHGFQVDIDGLVGPRTRDALSSVQGAAYCINIGDTWDSYLDLTAAAAFARL